MLVVLKIKVTHLLLKWNYILEMEVAHLLYNWRWHVGLRNEYYECVPRALKKKKPICFGNSNFPRALKIKVAHGF